MPQAVTVEGVGVTADLLLFRAYGRRGNTSRMLDLILDLNPGLAALGPVLPLGTTLQLPDLLAGSIKPKRKAVDLFGA